MSDSTEYILFGGSFNPPTLAHHSMVNNLIRPYLNRRILVEPVVDHAYGKDLVPYEHRLAMAKIAFSDLEEKGAYVTSFSKTLNLEDSRSTFCLLQGLTKFFGNNSKVSLLVGEDQAFDIGSKWIKGMELLSQHKIYVYPRGLDSRADELCNLYRNAELDILSQLSTSRTVISSSKVRALLAEGSLSEADEMLPYDILYYCRQNNLYQVNP